MGLGLPSVAGPAEPTAAKGLGVGGFHACSRRIGRGELWGLFTLSRCPQGQFFVMWVQGQAPRGRSGARTAEWTRLAIGPSEVHGHHGMVAPWTAVIAGVPDNTGVALGTDGLVRLPIDLELVALKALLIPCLPAKIAARRTDHIDLEPALGHDQTIGVNIAGIDQMGLGEPLCLG